jgi:phosphoribosylaminoimidazole (AIR) synthetase
MKKMKRIYKKYLRTIILAVAATATFVWSAIDMFGVDPQEMWQFFKLSGIGLVFIIALAAGLATLLKLLRR